MFCHGLDGWGACTTTTLVGGPSGGSVVGTVTVVVTCIAGTCHILG